MPKPKRTLVYCDPYDLAIALRDRSKYDTYSYRCEMGAILNGKACPECACDMMVNVQYKGGSFPECGYEPFVCVRCKKLLARRKVD